MQKIGILEIQKPGFFHPRKIQFQPPKHEKYFNFKNYLKIFKGPATMIKVISILSFFPLLFLRAIESGGNKFSERSGCIDLAG